MGDILGLDWPVIERVAGQAFGIPANRRFYELLRLFESTMLAEMKTEKEGAK